jgi:hypothetical protein
MSTIYKIWPHPGGRIFTPGIVKFTISVVIFLLYISMQLVCIKKCRPIKGRILKIGHFFAGLVLPLGILKLTIDVCLMSQGCFIPNLNRI